VPTEIHTATDPQRHLLSTVRQSQAAVLDTIRTWTTITEQLTRTLRLPVSDLDVAGAVDRAFDVAEQALTVQRQLALTVAGVATRQVEDLVDAAEAEQEQRDPAQPQAPKAESPGQHRKFDGRTYEERSIDELRERAGELQLEGRSSMNKEELIAALRNHRKARSAKNDAPRQERTPDRRAYEERSVEELRERAGELQVEGRSAMSKDELIAALRKHAR
jgi:hypothetical protein